MARMGMREALLVRNMLEDFGITVDGPHYHYDDSKTRVAVYTFEKDEVKYTMSIRKSLPVIRKVK